MNTNVAGRLCQTPNSIQPRITRIGERPPSRMPPRQSRYFMLEFLKIIAIFHLLQLAQMNWHTTEWNGGVNIKQKGGGFVFVLKSGAHINAVQANRPAVRINDIITVKYRVKTVGTTPPRFVSLDPAPAPPGLKPNLRPMLQVQHDDYVSQDNRWWPSGANCGFLGTNLTGQLQTLQIPIRPNIWTNVLGKPASQRMSGFRKVVQKAGNLNIVFGGGNSFSHGVSVKGGKVSITIVSVTIQKP
jgi:hypothetical protein